MRQKVVVAISGTEDLRPTDVLSALCEAFQQVCETAGYDTAEMFAHAAETAREFARVDVPKPLFPSKGGDA